MSDEVYEYREKPSGASYNLDGQIIFITKSRAPVYLGVDTASYVNVEDEVKQVAKAN